MQHSQHALNLFVAAVDTYTVSDADAEGETDDEIFSTLESQESWTPGYQDPTSPTRALASSSLPIYDWSKVSLHELLSTIPCSSTHSGTSSGHIFSGRSKRKRRSGEGKKVKKKLKVDIGDAAWRPGRPQVSTDIPQDEVLEPIRLDFSRLLNEEEVTDGNLRHIMMEARFRETCRRPKGQEKGGSHYSASAIGPWLQDLGGFPGLHPASISS